MDACLGLATALLILLAAASPVGALVLVLVLAAIALGFHHLGARIPEGR